MTIQQHLNKAYKEAERIYTDKDSKIYYMICYMIHNCSWLCDEYLDMCLDMEEGFISNVKKQFYVSK